MHPRTQQVAPSPTSYAHRTVPPDPIPARRMYTSLLDAKLQAERRAGAPHNQSQISAAAAAAGPP
eukprot:3336767-Rhodomonas_salina.1